MKLLQIRHWMFVGMLIVLLLPRLFYEIPGMLDRYVFERASHDQQQTNLNATIEELSKVDVSEWRDPNWQVSLENMLASSRIGIILLDSNNKEIFHSVPSYLEKSAARQINVFEQGQLQGSSLLFVPEQQSALAIAFSVIATAFVILFIGWQIGRVVVKPLEAMSAAARKIASGELDFHLPNTTVREVADVQAAFQVMRSGLRESLIRQSELEEERRFYISAIAHDLRTPLFSLRGALSWLDRGMTTHPEKASRYIQICSKKTEQINLLVSDLFAYTKMESLDQTMHLEVVAFHVLVEEIMDDYRPIGNEKGIEFELESPNVHCTFHGDAHLLKRALGNLIENALRYTPQSGKIAIHWHLEDTKLHFSIADSGPGIPKQDLPHVFEAFYRADSSRNPENGGTGLGLTIARRIIRAHQGELVAANRDPLPGAIFTGWIPLE